MAAVAADIDLLGERLADLTSVPFVRLAKFVACHNLALAANSIVVHTNWIEQWWQLLVYWSLSEIQRFVD